MKKYLFLLLILFPLSVNAYELSCDSGSYGFKDYFHCYVTGEVKEYNNISGYLSDNEYVDCKVASVDSKLTRNESRELDFELSGTPEDTKLVDYLCQVNKTLDSKKNIQLTIDNFKTNDITQILSSDYIELSNKSNNSAKDDKPRDTKNKNTLLESLSIKELDIKFSKFLTTYSYSVLYNVSKLTLDYKTVNPSSTVVIDGSTDLNIGMNIIDLYVIDEENNKTCYTLKINRLPEGEEIYYEDQDDYLANLEVEGYSINFDRNKTDYVLKLPNAIESLNINANPNIKDAYVEILGNSNLHNGSIISINVTSTNKQNTRRYEIKIIKEVEKKSSISIFILIGLGILFVLGIFIFLKTSKREEQTVYNVDINK